MALVVASWLLLGVLISGASVAWQLDRTADALQRVGRALRADDLSSARAATLDARVAAWKARLSSSDPALRAMGVLPVLGDELDALGGLARAADTVTGGAVELVSSIEAARSGDSLTTAIYRDGVLALDTIEDLGPALDRFRRHVRSARAGLTPAGGISVPALRRAVGDADRRLGRAGSSLELAASATRLAPAVAGGRGERRYLLAFQSPSEARGGGGLIGVYGILSAVDGRPAFDHVGPIEELGPLVRPPVRAAPAFTRTYGPLSALTDWRQANVSPDFPATAANLLQMYERARGQALDGVIALDPIALGELTRGTGPLSAPGWDVTITPENARRALLFDIYRRFVHREKRQNVYLRNLVDELWSRVQEAELDAAGLLDALAESRRKQHLKVFLRAPEEQELLTSLGLASDLTLVEGPLQMAFNNNNAGNKLDFFLHRWQDVSIRMADDGSASVRAEFTLDNETPTRGLRAVGRAGPRTGLTLGENRMSFHVLLPRGSRTIKLFVDGRQRSTFRGTDSGMPMVWRLLTIPPDGSVVVAIEYSFDLTGDARFTLWPQAAARPDLFSLEILGPDGAEVGSWAGRLRAPRSFLLDPGREGGT